MKYKVDDKVIFNPAEKDKLTGVFTVSEIKMELGVPYIKLKEVKECIWFNPNRFLKVPLFKVGQLITFRNIKDDLWFSDIGVMRDLEGESGIIEEVMEYHYIADKPGQDGCQYKVKHFKTEQNWYVTSTSIESVLASITTETLAQAVDNVKASQFKIGDKVVIRDDLIPGKEYFEWNGWTFRDEMTQYRGKIATIVGFRNCDSYYYSLDIDEKRWSWIQDSLLHYTPGSDYDLDKINININQQKQNKQNENRLQEKGPVIAGRERQSGCAVRYPGEQIRVGISNLGYRKVTCKRQEGS